jgi:hypothetical protein
MVPSEIVESESAILAGYDNCSINTDHHRHKRGIEEEFRETLPKLGGEKAFYSKEGADTQNDSN